MNNKVKNIFLRSRYRRPFLIIVVLIILCSVVIPIASTFIKEGRKGGAYKEYYSDEKVHDRLNVDINLLPMDPLTRNANFLVQIDPQGNLLNSEGMLASNLTINFRYKQLKYTSGSNMEPFTMSVPFIDGSLREYPLDEYTAAFPIILINVKKSGKTNVPFFISLDGVSQLFKIRYAIENANEVFTELAYNGFFSGAHTEVAIITLKRPPTAKVICVFVGLLMWTLAVALVNVAWDAVIYKREILPPILTLGVSMMFALPALRNAQPGVPAMGCFSDMIGFFWVMVLIAISSSSLIFSWVLSWRPHFLRKSELIA